MSTYHLAIHFQDNIVPGASAIPGLREARSQAWQSLEENPYSSFVEVLDDKNAIVETMERVKITD